MFFLEEPYDDRWRSLPVAERSTSVQASHGGYPHTARPSLAECQRLAAFESGAMFKDHFGPENSETKIYGSDSAGDSPVYLWRTSK